MLLLLQIEPLNAASLWLDDGTEVKGEVVAGYHNSLVVKASDGAIRPILVVRIKEVVLGEIRGQYAGWDQGVFRIRTGGETLTVTEDGRVVSREPLAQQAVTPPDAAEPNLEAEFSEFLSARRFSAAELHDRDRMIQLFYFWLHNRDRDASSR